MKLLINLKIIISQVHVMKLDIRIVRFEFPETPSKEGFILFGFSELSLNYWRDRQTEIDSEKERSYLLVCSPNLCNVSKAGSQTISPT